MHAPRSTTDNHLSPPVVPNESSFVLLFLVATLVVYFSTVRLFFFYEDDYFTVGVPAAQSLHWVWEQICFVWRTWPQGRPAMFTALALEGGIIHATGSIVAGYIPSFLIISANGYLLYRLLKLRFAQIPAIAGALFGFVSCADPHKILLTHAPLQFAITLNLLGLLFYLKERYVLAYLIAGSSLFFYEISFGIFACAELFRQLQTKPDLKRIVTSWVAWLGVVAAVFSIRLVAGETRAVEVASNLTELCTRIFTNVLYGPAYGLENSYVHPLAKIARQPDFWFLIVSIVIVVGILAAGMGASRKLQKESDGAAINPLLSVAVLGLLVFGPYALQVKRTVYEGFMRPVSGYHLGMGVALGFAAALLLTKFLRRPVLTRVVSFVLIVLSGASIYQNLLIQSDYARSARYQAHFWAETRRLANDAKPGDVILVPRHQLLETEYILSNSWGITHGWNVLFEQTGPLKDWFNIASERPVSVFLVPEDWEKQIIRGPESDVLPLADYTPPGFAQGQIPLRDGQVIVLEATWGEPFVRRNSPIVTAGHQINLRKAPQSGAVGLNYTKPGKYLFENFIN